MADPRQPFFTPDASPTRRAVERRSAVLVTYLRRIPLVVVGAAVVALFMVGVFVPGPAGAVPLLVLAAFLAWLSYLGWPGLPPPARLIRLVGIGFVLVVAVLRAGG
jgi:hypothetical protein